MTILRDMLKPKAPAERDKLPELLANFVAGFKGDMLFAAQHISAELGVPVQAAHNALSGAIRQELAGTHSIAVADGRAASWYVRIRLYRTVKPGAVEADTDPDTAPDQRGETVINGLPGVAEFLRDVAQGFHRETCTGLDKHTLEHRLKSLRPTLSRRGGNAAWRVPYRCSTGDWTARVDVEKVKQ